MKVAREEIFGPVMSIIPFDSLDEVIERVNKTMYGLAASARWPVRGSAWPAQFWTPAGLPFSIGDRQLSPLAPLRQSGSTDRRALTDED